MKKIILIVAALCISIGIIGCGNQNTDEKSMVQESDKQRINEEDNSENTVQSATQTPANMEELTAIVKTVTDKVNIADTAGTEEENKAKYMELKAELDKAEHSVELYDEMMETKHRAGEMKDGEYRKQDTELDKLEDQLDSSEDSLEILYGID